MRAILEFFKTGTLPVAPEETLEALAIIEIAVKHRDKFDTWTDMGDFLS
jgi:hypothetical protein